MVKKSYRWNASVRSFVLATLQGHQPEGATIDRTGFGKMRSRLIDRDWGTFQVEVVGTPDFQTRVSALALRGLDILLASDTPRSIPMTIDRIGA